MSNYGYGSAEPSPEYRQHRTFKTRLRDYLNRLIEKEYNKSAHAKDLHSIHSSKFNNSFDGWHIRLHKSVDGHIVEAWRNDEGGPYITSGPSGRRQEPSHLLFTIRAGEDMGAAMSDIFVQLALRT